MRRTTRRTTAILLAAALAAAGGGCGERRGDARPLVGVALPPEASAFFQDLTRGMEQAADSLGLELRVLTVPGGGGVDTLVRQRVAAIVIASSGASGAQPATERAIAGANRARIPVFTTGVASEGAVVAHVASDDRQGGRLLGEFVGARLRGGGNVVILDQPGERAVRERVAGFRQALTAYPNIRVLAAPAVEGGAENVARQKMENLLATGQSIDAVFGTSEGCALGALAAIQGAGRRTVVVVGYDVRPDSGLAARAMQDPAAIGRRTIEAVAARLRGEAVPALVTVPVSLVEP